jgi:hypothetical protein
MSFTEPIYPANDLFVHYKLAYTGSSGGDWTSTKGDATTAGDYVNSSEDESITYPGIESIRDLFRNVDSYRCSRSYFKFNLGRQRGRIKSASFHLWMKSIGVGSSTFHRKVKIAEATSLAIHKSDYGNIFTSSTNLGTILAPHVIASESGTLHEFVFNSDGIAALQDKLGTNFYIGAASGFYDIGTFTPTAAGGAFAAFEVRYKEYSSTGSDPHLIIEYHDNAVFMGANF